MALVGLASSCQKESKSGLPAPSEAILSVNVIADEDTKAEVAANEFEKKVSTVQIGIFDRTNGQINAYRRLESGTSATFSVMKGEKTVIAIVNGPDISSAASLASVMQITAPFADFNNSDGLLMYGGTPCSLDGDTSCEVTVKRLVSRVSLASVKNSLPSGYGTISVDYALVSNVSDAVLISGVEPETHGWLNWKGVADSPVNTLNYAAYSPLSVAAGASATPGSMFYFYPCAQNSSPIRLVVAATISGKRYYYPVELGNELLANSAYSVSLTIVGLGSSDPDVPVDKKSLAVSVKVSNWTGGKTYDEQI